MNFFHNWQVVTSARRALTFKTRGAKIVIILIIFAVSVPAVFAQTPQNYELTWLGEGRPRDINESGVVAFGYAATVYDHATGDELDLNDPAYGATWTDLEGNEDETGQWTVYHCNGINESNQIIGTASHVNGAEANRNFILYDPLSPEPVFELFPRNILDANQGNVCINDLGEFAQGREINNAGVVVGHGFVQYPDGTVQTFDDDHFSGINDAGTVTGYRRGIHSGPPSGRRDGGPLLFHYLNPPELLVSGTETNYHGDVNNLGDVAFSENSRGFIYLAGSASPVNLDQLVVAQSQQDYDDWIGTSIFPSGINDAGQIIGQAKRGGWHGFILTPIAPGPGISVSPTAGLTTSEDGDWDEFIVVLDMAPIADVTIGINSDDSTEGTADVTSLTFTSANWDTPQTVTITGVDDAIEDGDIAYTIVTSLATSTDPDYDGLDPDDVMVTNQDNEQPPGGNANYSSGAIDLTIPDNDPDGVSSVITSVPNHDPLVLTVTLNITDHRRPSDLEAFVTGPDGTQLQLFNVLGDNDLTGLITDTEGDWLLEVFDSRKKKEGTLQSWSITIDY